MPFPVLYDMSRRLRFVPPGGSVVEVTTRTIQGRLLLTPSPKFNQIILGVLGRAQRRYEVEIHEFVFMSNHYHLLLSVKSALQLARFTGYFNGNLAKEVVRHTGWRDKVWSRRYQAVLVSEEQEAQLSRLRYIFSHGVKENLVDSVRDWPGVSSLKARLEGESLEGLWFDRTREAKGRRRGDELTSVDIAEKERVRLTPLPCLDGLSQAEMRGFIEGIVASVEERAIRGNRPEGGRSLGAQQVLRLHPTAKPRKSKRSPAPFAYCASRENRRLLWKAYCWFFGAYLDAKESLRAGRVAEFPAGAFPPPGPFVDTLLEPG